MNAQELDQIRHSLAHLLATAVLEEDPNAKLAIGPTIETGFYYDFELSPEFSLDEAMLKKLTKRMRSLVKRGIDFSGEAVTAEDARKRWEDQPYKLELIDEFSSDGKELTAYTSGDFTDLCRGGHVENTKEIPVDAFKLDRVAGAYWRGDEANTMLTRIYGLAFATKEELDTYLEQREEAKKRDHRKLGRELDLFTFSDLVGPGLPLWTPRGTMIRTLLDTYVWELRSVYGYDRVTIPHITKRALYETSGHWDKFAEELFRIKTREDKEFALKPMNCPHHTQIYNHIPRSYRDMPQRYAETTTVYRDEQSGELGGLTRVVSITQDDSHIFCRTSQIKQEFNAIWDIIDTFYRTFDFEIHARLSFHDPEHFEQCLGTEDVWKTAESALTDIAKERGAEYTIAIGEAAMYGPKLDFMATDSLGREHQVATIQLDMNLPDRFNLTCTNEDGKEERIVMIHSAIMGSIERFTAVLIEHLYGNFPLWLSPEQVRILPIGEAHREYAQSVLDHLTDSGIRAKMDGGDETLGKRIRQVKHDRLPYFIVIGDQEVSEKTAMLEGRSGKIGALAIDDLIERFKSEISERKSG
jgi:threonyl-tRNA synthetase